MDNNDNFRSDNEREIYEKNKILDLIMKENRNNKINKNNNMKNGINKIKRKRGNKK